MSRRRNPSKVKASADLELVLDLADSFMRHWEEDDGLDAKERREARLQRKAFDGAARRLRSTMAALQGVGIVEVEVLRSLLGNRRSELEGDPHGFDALSKLGMENMQKAQRFADRLAENAGFLQRYLDYRGCAGCSDHGHEAGMAAGALRSKQIRKALGYTFP